MADLHLCAPVSSLSAITRLAAAGGADRAGALGILLLLYVMYEWGRFEGGYSKFAEIQRRRELAAKIESLEQENEKLRARRGERRTGAQRR